MSHDASHAGRVVEVRSVVRAPRDEVWARVVSVDGIRDELAPWLTMTMPRGMDGLDVATLPVGQPLGRAWLRLFGVLPVDFDDLTIVALEPGRRFHEVSRMMSARRWEHERTLRDAGPGTTEVHDRLVVVPRLAPHVVGPVAERVVRLLFEHRHRRLARHLDSGPFTQ